MASLEPEPAKTPNLTIFLVLLGDPSDHIFSVTAPYNTSMVEWKKLVYAEKRNRLSMQGYDAADLILWKLHEPIRGEDVDARMTALGQNLSEVAVRMLPTKMLLDYFPSTLTKDCVHVIVTLPSLPSAGGKHDRPSEDDARSEPEAKRKKGHYAPVDMTHSLLTRWSPGNIQLPPISDLAAYLTRPLQDEEKVPVSESELLILVTEGSPTTLCTREDLEQLVRYSEVEKAHYIWRVMSNAITFDPPAANGTEASFISFWDQNIRRIVETLVPSSSGTIRDSNQGTNTGLLRPDYGFVVLGICVFRGEEKPLIYSGTHPKGELINKLTWTYDPAPYILGYYAVGPKVTLVAITGTKVFDLVEVDLSHKANRVKFVICLIRLSSLLVPLATLVGHRATAELEPLARSGDKTVSIGARAILKTFQGAEHARQATYLQGIYRTLKEKAVPNVDSPTTWRIEATMSSVYLEPKGRNRLPSSEQELRDAVGCILEALVIMHAEPKPMFHRDIRWPNIIQRADDLDRWFLIDWDDAAIYPTRARPTLSTTNHCPSVFQDGHGAEVDLWAVGMLIREAEDFIPGVSPEWMAFAKRLMEREATSARQALGDLRQFRGEV